MERQTIEPRPHWERIVESQGFHFHSPDGQPYWDESAYYRFSASEIDDIERATYAVNEMCLAAVQHVIDHDLFARFEIPAVYKDFVVQSWTRDDFTLYGRFDLAFDGQTPPRLLEFNADTPTALLEAAVIQWQWFRDVLPEQDQYNSIHEKLVEAWRAYQPRVSGTLYFASLAGVVEDYMTVNYLRDTAIQAGLTTQYIEVEQIGWDRGRGQFVDADERPLSHVFKLYPWEWMLREAFGPHLIHDTVRWLEAPWKMILSNKAILPVLHELYPESPYLLPASFEPLGESYVRKPLYSREGANVAVVSEGRTVIETDGDYEGTCIYQELHWLPRFGDHYAVVGSWMVNGFACGIGIREDTTPVTRNTSRFVPHVFGP